MTEVSANLRRRSRSRTLRSPSAASLNRLLFTLQYTHAKHARPRMDAEDGTKARHVDGHSGQRLTQPLAQLLAVLWVRRICDRCLHDTRVRRDDLEDALMRVRFRQHPLARMHLTVTLVQLRFDAKHVVVVGESPSNPAVTQHVLKRVQYDVDA